VLLVIWIIIPTYVEHTSNLYGTPFQLIWNILPTYMEHHSNLYGTPFQHSFSWAKELLVRYNQQAAGCRVHMCHTPRL